MLGLVVSGRVPESTWIEGVRCERTTRQAGAGVGLFFSGRMKMRGGSWWTCKDGIGKRRGREEGCVSVSVRVSVFLGTEESGE
jgi:hypothetical protein